MAKGGRSRASDASSASVARWETNDDIPMDDEETFHHNRDKILLGGNDGDSDDEQGESTQ